MKYYYILIIFLFSVSCATNPFTGKKTLALVPNSQLIPMSFQEYEKKLTEYPIVKGTEEARMITRVGDRISKAAKRYLTANGYAGYLQDYRWEYKLLENDEANAWCLPGGKIAFYTGILPLCETEAGVAAVMGHEVAHALANHGQQRISAAELQALGAVAGNIALANDPKNQAIFNVAYGIGTNVGVMLPFSRSHESEADRIGLILMAIAGYDPSVAAEFWVRMKNSKDKEPAELLNTHPSSDTRINNIKAWVPSARAEAKKYGVTSFQR